MFNEKFRIRNAKAKVVTAFEKKTGNHCKAGYSKAGDV